MGLALLVLLAAGGGVAADFKTACENAAVGDACEYESNATTCCTMMTTQGGDREKFCRGCTQPGFMTRSKCSIHSRQGYLGCFSQKEDAAVFQVCVGATRGDNCIYETAAGRGKRAYNTTGHCIAHYNHQQVMCLEAVGDEDDGECNGKGVGMPCTHSTSPNALCAHHSRRGHWMCLAPAEENRAFVVCQGVEAGAACSYTSNGSHGPTRCTDGCECHPHHGHGGMMCVDPATLPAPAGPESEGDDITDGSGDTTLIIVVCVVGATVIVVLAVVAVAIFVRFRKKAPASSAGASPNFVVGQPVHDETAVGAKPA